MKTDVLIVGSGVAAAALSQRLLEANPSRDILILEAGPRVPMQDPAVWAAFMATNGPATGVLNELPYQKCYDFDYPSNVPFGENRSAGTTSVPLIGGRAMVYGGSTIHWGGWSFRLKPEDFRMKTNTGKGLNWPIDYDDLEPYYGQAECYIGVSGDSSNQDPRRSGPYPFPAFPFTLEDEQIRDALDSLNMNPMNLPIARRGITQTTSRHAPCKTTGTCKYCPFGARYAAPNYLDDMLNWGNFPNLKVKENCVVDYIVMSSKRRAEGVSCYDKTTGKRITIEASTVVVAGGAIESPKLLQRSVSTYWPQGVGNDRDLVGRYFVTHPYFTFTAVLPGNPNHLQTEMDFPTLCTRFFDSPEQQAKGKYLIVSPPNLFSSLVDGNPSSIAQMMQVGMTRRAIQEALAGPAQLQIVGLVEVENEYTNMVSNLKNRNHLYMYQTNVDFSQSPDFNARMNSIQETATKIFTKMGASAKTVSQQPISWRADHSACTTRMAENANEGVVDKNLKVFGVDNLYVCSNASFTNIGAVNPTLTLTALSLRLGEHLA